MAVLDAAGLAKVYADFVHNLNQRVGGETIGIVRQDLRDAVAAIDAWADANAASFNTAIPQPARGALTTKQKARLLMYVVKRRHEVA